MYSGRQPAITPFTATFQTVARRLSGKSTPSSVSGRPVAEAEELGDAVGSRRHDRQAVAPVVLVVEAVDLVEGPLEDDVARAPAPRPRRPRVAGASVRLRITASTVTAATFSRSSSGLCTSTWPGTSAVGRPGSPSPVEVVAACPRKPSQTRDAVGTPARSATALARNTAGVQLPQQAIPEMTASTSWRRSISGSSASTRCSCAAVGGAEGVVAHEADAGEASRQLLLEDREDLVAAEEIVPELADGLALERVEPRGDVGGLHGPRPARPHHPVDLASVRSVHAPTSEGMVESIPSRTTVFFPTR